MSCSLVSILPLRRQRCRPNVQGLKSAGPLRLTRRQLCYSRLESQLQTFGYAPSRILLVMEATGSYWISLVMHLVHEGFRVSVINPAQAHYFAKALLKRAKTDAIDAQTLAQLASVLQPEPWMPPPQIYYELQQRLAQRDDLLNLRQQVRNQLHALDQHPKVRLPAQRAGLPVRSASQTIACSRHLPFIGKKMLLLGAPPPNPARIRIYLGGICPPNPRTRMTFLPVQGTGLPVMV